MRRALTAISVVLLVAVAMAGTVAGQTPAAPSVATGDGVDVRALDVEGEGFSLSPDGQWLAGVGPDRTPCFWDMETLTPQCADTELPILAHPLFPAMAWAPDSSAVVFSLDAIRMAYDSDIYLFERESAALTNLTDDGYEDSLLDAPRDTPIDIMPSWSFDGQQIVFSRSVRTDEASATSVMRIAREGGDPAEVYTPDLDEPLTIWMPMTWLPNDTVVFSIASVDPDEPLNGIWRVSVDGAEPTKIVAGDRASGIPAAMVADISEETGAMSVYSPLLLGQYSVAWEEPLFWIGSLDDASVTPIPQFDTATGEALIATPAAPDGDVMTPAAPAAISPDGETALLVYRSAEGRYSLATMALASGEVVPVASLPDGTVVQPVAPQWADDGTVLLLTGDAPVTLTMPAT